MKIKIFSITNNKLWSMCSVNDVISEIIYVRNVLSSYYRVYKCTITPFPFNPHFHIPGNEDLGAA